MTPEQLQKRLRRLEKTVCCIKNTAPTSSSPDSIDWKVDVAASGLAPLADGDAGVTLDGTGGMPDLRGYNINFFRGGIIQYTNDPEDGSTYYSWDKVTGILLLLGPIPEASLTEQMRITPTL